VKRATALAVTFGLMGVLKALWGMEAVYGFIAATVLFTYAWYRKTGEMPDY